jgi:hypothetical protein
MRLSRAVQVGIEHDRLEAQVLALGVDELQEGLAQLVGTGRGNRSRGQEKDGQQNKVNPLRS